MATRARLQLPYLLVPLESRHRGLGVDSRSLLVTGAGGSAGHNVCWSLRMSRDGKTTLLTGTDSDRTSLQLNLWIDRAYHLPRAGQRDYLTALNKVIEKEGVESVFPQPDREVRRVSEVREKLHAQVFLLDKKAVSNCLDKFETLMIWHRTGLRNEPIVLSANDASVHHKITALEYPCWIRAREGAGGLLSCRAS